jgi:hypothetical protein
MIDILTICEDMENMSLRIFQYLTLYYIFKNSLIIHEQITQS